MDMQNLKRYAWLSIAAALITIGLKGGAYALTGSVGLLSDAMESLVNLVAALVALAALTVAARPPDEEHAYGHEKVEYFSSGIEGALILLAALSIGITSVQRLLNPAPVEQIELGVLVSTVASLVNLGVARVLLKAGRKYGSITLEADAKHLMTDVWTSVGVIIGVAAVGITGLSILDPLIGLAVALNIVLSGTRLVHRSVYGLLDTALPAQEMDRIRMVMHGFEMEGIQFHALRSRQSGARRFLSMHILVPGHWTVQRGHDLIEQVEREVRAVLPNATVFTHLEPQEDPLSFADMHLDRYERVH
jgi:cation diffusion facilitator family transporter